MSISINHLPDEVICRIFEWFCDVPEVIDYYFPTKPRRLKRTAHLLSRVSRRWWYIAGLKGNHRLYVTDLTFSLGTKSFDIGSDLVRAKNVLSASLKSDIRISVWYHGNDDAVVESEEKLVVRALIKIFAEHRDQIWILNVTPTFKWVRSRYLENIEASLIEFLGPCPHVRLIRLRDNGQLFETVPLQHSLIRLLPRSYHPLGHSKPLPSIPIGSFPFTRLSLGLSNARKMNGLLLLPKSLSHLSLFHLAFDHESSYITQEAFVRLLGPITYLETLVLKEIHVSPSNASSQMPKIPSPIRELCITSAPGPSLQLLRSIQTSFQCDRISILRLSTNAYGVGKLDETGRLPDQSLSFPSLTKLFLVFHPHRNVDAAPFLLLGCLSIPSSAVLQLELTLPTATIEHGLQDIDRIPNISENLIFVFTSFEYSQVQADLSDLPLRLIHILVSSSTKLLRIKANMKLAIKLDRDAETEEDLRNISLDVLDFRFPCDLAWLKLFRNSTIRNLNVDGTLPVVAEDDSDFELPLITKLTCQIPMVEEEEEDLQNFDHPTKDEGIEGRNRLQGGGNANVCSDDNTKQWAKNFRRSLRPFTSLYHLHLRVPWIDDIFPTYTNHILSILKCLIRSQEEEEETFLLPCLERLTLDVSEVYMAHEPAVVQDLVRGLKALIRDRESLEVNIVCHGGIEVVVD